MSIGIVILAAGASARMGEPKQLLAYHETTLLQHTIETALVVPNAPVVVVLGAAAAEIRAQLDGTRVLIVENPAWCDGMGGSIRVGLSALLAAHPALSAVLFLLCDQPLLSATKLSLLIATQQFNRAAIIASEYGGTLGVPALFARSLFPELLALEGAEGARRIIHRHRELVVGIPFPEGTVDIDTPADYARLHAISDDVSTPTPV